MFPLSIDRTQFAYLRCVNTQALVEQIVALLTQEGMRPVDRLRAPLHDAPAARNNRWAVQLLAGESGWHVLRAAPCDLWCSRAPAAGSARFVALCKALAAPGLLLMGGEDAADGMGEVLLETDGKGAAIVSGQWRDLAGDAQDATFYGYLLRSAPGDEIIRPSSAGARKLWDDSQASTGPWADEEISPLKRFSYHLARTLLAHEWWDIERNLPELGGTTLLFEWPAQDRPEPPAPEPLDLFYADGSRAREGDAVLLDHGLASGRVTTALYSVSAPSALVVSQPGQLGQTAIFARQEPADIGIRGDGAPMRLVGRLGPDVQLIERDTLHHASAAVRWLRERAQNGDTVAMLTLGLRYAKGIDVPPEGDRWGEWMAKAADAGHVEAQYLAGLMSEDHAVAARYWQMAAERGDADAQFNLGRAYQFGEGVSQSYQMAHHWLGQAFRQGHMGAHYNMGNAWAGGRKSAPRGNPRAEWFAAQAEAGDPVAPWVMGLCTEYGLSGAAKDPVAAVRWYRMGVNGGHGPAICNLADKYEHGTGVPQDLAEALRLYREAAAKNVSAAMFSLGEMFRDGRGVERDIGQARHWLTLADEAGWPGAAGAIKRLPGGPLDKARSVLAEADSAAPPGSEIMYREAIGIYDPADPEALALAFALHSRAADRGHAKARFQLGFMHLRGFATERDAARAAELYRQAAQQGYDDAQEALAELYEAGEGVPCDPRQAAYWRGRRAETRQ